MEGFTDAVDVVGNYAYIGQGQDLVILDITNPSSPVSVGRTMTKNLISGVKISGNYAYLAAGDNGLVIVDVSNPSSPVLKGSYDTPGYASSIAISGNYAYLADDYNGLDIIDISNPSSPIVEGGLDSLWGIGDVSISDNITYVTDSNNGILILKTDLEHPVTSVGNLSITQPENNTKSLKQENGTAVANVKQTHGQKKETSTSAKESKNLQDLK
ncbi:MAG TPA: hypothetical protein VGK06_04770 [Methanosarcina sp.]